MKDEFHGQGGSYELAPDGTRRLVARTMTQDEANDRSAQPIAPAPAETPAATDTFAPKRQTKE